MKHFRAGNLSVFVLVVTACASNAQIPAYPKGTGLNQAPHLIVEPAAMLLLKQNQDAMFALNSYQAECRTKLSTVDSTRYRLATLKVEKPDKMRYEAWNSASPDSTASMVSIASDPGYVFACDGVNLYKQFGASYSKVKYAKPTQLNTISEPWIGFFANSKSILGTALESQKIGDLKEVTFKGQELVGGETCDRVYIRIVLTGKQNRFESDTLWYLGSDHLVKRSLNHGFFGKNSGVYYDAFLTNVKTNSPIQPVVYQYTPPAGVQSDSDSPGATKALLAQNIVAPDFSASDIASKSIKLSDYRGSVVVVDFWASWCGPCKASMPHNEAVLEKLAKANVPVVFIGVDDGEERKEFESWVRTTGSKYPLIKFVHNATQGGISSTLYNVTGIPTQYVIDKSGKISASFVGYGGASDELEKAIRAALQSGVSI